MDRIASTLEGKTLLVTGATGFLGQPLIEKILWSAPGVARIHVLIRPKRQFGSRIQSPAERLRRELFESSVFDRLRFRHGEEFECFLEGKLSAVAGDISQKGLGLEPAVREELQRTVDVLINSAAVVSFDAPLDDALELNALGPGRIAAFARECDHAILVHVSTAYVCGATDQSVPETIHHQAEPDVSAPFPQRQFTDPQRDIDHARGLIEAVRERGRSPEVRRELVQALVQRRRGRGGSRNEPRREMIENLRGRWVHNRLVEEGMAWARERGWNDTYTYTKALGEQVVLRERGEVPTAIIRPAIIESSLAEPSPGWLDGLRMADPLIAAIGKGRLRSLPLDPEVVLDLVPADMVVNAMLAAIARLVGNSGVTIYQVATGSRNPVTMGRLHELILGYFSANPMLDKNGDPIRVKPLTFPSPTLFRLSHRLKSAPLAGAEWGLQQLIDRGAFEERAQRWKRRVAAGRAALEKLHYYGELYEPYLNLDCRFEVDNTMRLYEWLNEEERRRYDFDVTRLNWRHYMHVHIAGVKKHILKVERAGTFELDDEVAAQQASVSTIAALLEHSAQRFPDRTALQIQRGGEWRRFTYAELRQSAVEIEARFRGMGLRKGERVVLYSENQPEWGMAYFGAAAVGLVVVPLDAQTWHREVWSVARFTDAHAILASTACFARLTAESRVENERSERPILLLDVNDACRPFPGSGAPPAEAGRVKTRPPEPVKAEVKAEPVKADDLASIIFTTGTMSDPRGAMHTHRSFLNNLFGVSRYLSVSEDDRFLSVLPLYHALEFTCGFLAPIYCGGTITYTRSIKPKAILETMRETGITIMLGVPTLYALIRDDLERRVLRAAKSPLRSNLMATTKQLSRSWERTFNRNIGRQIFNRVHQELGGRIRFFVSGGSALGADLYEDYRTLGLTIYEGYGLTETAPVLTVNPLYQSRRGSCGKPLPGVELRLYRTDSDGVGEIIVQSPSLMKGYFRNPAATERVLIDGWFHTGDLGWVDADGYLYITGRIKDVIVTGAGKNVYPIDLEAIYQSIPAVREICVVGIPSGLTEEVHAIVVPEPAALEGASGEEARKLILNAIQAVARDLPSYHRLQQVHLREEPLPRTPDSAVDRRTVRRNVRERLRSESADRRAVVTPVFEDGTREAWPEDAVRAEIERLSGIAQAEISDASRLADDLGLDSLKAIELLLFLEHELGVSLDDETAASIETVEDLLAEVRPAGRRRRALPRLSSRGAARPSRQPPGREPRRPAIRSALPFDERGPVDRLLLGTAGRGLEALYTGYFDLKIKDAERLPLASPYLIAANHASHLDAPALLAAIRVARGPEAARTLHVLGARDYFFDTPLKRWFFSTFLNVVPIEREEASLAGLRLVKSILASGESALIFPEGTRSRSGEIQPFKPGLGLLAWELKVPIVPAHVAGTHEALPAGRALPRRRRVTVSFGEPVTMEAYQEAGERLPRDALYRTIAADVRRTVVALANGRAPVARRA
ncbi:MAG TPA: AMP-binding protein [Gemmatimonadota bacterium]|nr:AMP-binding protein [Gemmatimonadota bacterium]